MSKQIIGNQILNDIHSKALYLDSVSLVAQEGKVEDLSPEIIENLFGLLSSLSRDISNLALAAMSSEESNA